MNPALMATGAAALLGAVLLAFAAVRLLGVLRESVVARLSAATQQEVDFPAPGRYILQLEQPRLDTPLNQASFALRDAAGREVASAPSVFRTVTSGVSTARISVRVFDVARAGHHTLVASGIPSGRDLSRCALILTRPFAGALMLCILGMLLGAASLIGGSVLTVLYLAGRMR